MPWQKRTELSLRSKFIELRLENLCSMSELCAEFGISRKTGYKFWNRFSEQGFAGLEDQRCNRPERKGLFSSEVWDAVFEYRMENPTYGPRKIVRILQRSHPEVSWPSISLVKQRFKEQGLSNPHRGMRRIIRERLPLRDINAPNDVWSIDFKGWFTSSDGRRCEPLTLLDGYSRYLLACELVPKTNFGVIRPVVEKAFYEYGKPNSIRSDNGPPFGSNGLRGLTPFSIWLLKLGIFPEKIMPGKPGQNGRLERLHRTLKTDVLCKSHDFAGYELAIESFLRKYNEIRPHESLNDKPPASVYRRSNRDYIPGKYEEYEYPSGYRLHKVNSHGYVKLSGSKIYLSESLCKEYIGVGSEEDGMPMLFLGYPLGRVSEHLNRTGSSYKKKHM